MALIFSPQYVIVIFYCLQKWAEEEDHSDGEGKILYGIPVSLKNDVPLVVSIFQYITV